MLYHTPLGVCLTAGWVVAVAGLNLDPTQVVGRVVGQGSPLQVGFGPGYTRAQAGLVDPVAGSVGLVGLGPVVAAVGNVVVVGKAVGIAALAGTVGKAAADIADRVVAVVGPDLGPVVGHSVAVRLACPGPCSAVRRQLGCCSLLRRISCDRRPVR